MYEQWRYFQPAKPERILLTSTAVQFLLKNRFNFGLPLINGIPYLSRVEEKQARTALTEEDQIKRPNMTTNKVEDEALIKHIRKSVADWQQQPIESREAYLNIPNEDRGKAVPGVLNRYQMRLTHQIIQNEFPGFKTMGMQNFVQITNPSREEMERLKLLQRQRIDSEIGRAIGFRWILEALAGREISGMPDSHFLTSLPDSAIDGLQTYIANLNEQLRRRRRVIVGHNCFTDLVNLHKFFIGDLPDSVEDFQDSVHDIFPAIVDTKYMASLGSRRWGDTSLQAVAEEMDGDHEPGICVPEDFDRYTNNDSEHEAGFDSLLTAKIAIKLSAKMERTQVYMEKPDVQSTASQPGVVLEPFGIREDGYVTASEDLDHPATDDSTVDAQTQSALAPVVGNDPDSDHQKQSPSSTPTTWTPKLDAPLSTASEPDKVVAVKDKKPTPVNWNSVAEVEKVRNAFSTTNMYEMLDGDVDGDGAVQDRDLMSFSDPNSPSNTKARAEGQETVVDIEQMVKQGRLMPRWDGGNGFWQKFGNKLQVNGCKEGVCHL